MGSFDPNGEFKKLTPGTNTSYCKAAAELFSSALSGGADMTPRHIVDTRLQFVNRRTLSPPPPPLLAPVLLQSFAACGAFSIGLASSSFTASLYLVNVSYGAPLRGIHAHILVECSQQVHTGGGGSDWALRGANLRGATRGLLIGVTPMPTRVSRIVSANLRATIVCG